MMYSLLGFLVTIGILVAFHELGHYWVARRCGVKVLRFSFGFGPVLFARRLGRDQTEWALSAVPLGGYVRMLDERDGEPIVAADLPRAFNRQALGKRCAIVAAGPLANLLLAIVLLSAVNMIGVPGHLALLSKPAAETPAATAGLQLMDRIVAVDGKPATVWEDVWRNVNWWMLEQSGKASGTANAAALAVTVERSGQTRNVSLDVPVADVAGGEENWSLPELGLRPYRGAPVIKEVMRDGPASDGGLREGDRIRAVDGVAIHAAGEMIEEISGKGETPVELSVLRDNQIVNLTVIPRWHEEKTREGGKAKKTARIGVVLGDDPATRERYTVTVRYDPLAAIALGATRTWELTAMSFRVIGRMLIGRASLKNLSGPITIADYAGESAKRGVTEFMAYLALVSIGLGVLNLLPVPLLDGGHLLYYFAEFVRGKPLSERAAEIGQRLGLAFIITLIALALLNDFSRLL